MANRAFASLALVFLITVPIFAHAILLEATPSANGSVAGPDFDVKLRFNSRIDAARSRLTLVRPDQTLLAISIQPSQNAALLDGRITGLHSGEYKLRWQVLAADGHITRGEIPFQVR